MELLLREAGPYAVSLVTLLAGWLAGRRGRRAAANRDDADAVESLSSTVARLGQEILGLYVRLAAAEARAAASEARAIAYEGEVAKLRADLGRLRGALHIDNGGQ